MSRSPPKSTKLAGAPPDPWSEDGRRALRSSASERKRSGWWCSRRGDAGRSGAGARGAVGRGSPSGSGDRRPAPYCAHVLPRPDRTVRRHRGYSLRAADIHHRGAAHRVRVTGRVDADERETRCARRREVLDEALGAEARGPAGCPTRCGDPFHRPREVRAAVPLDAGDDLRRGVTSRTGPYCPTSDGRQDPGPTVGLGLVR
jgi:hypothetical protein